jgi:hypothetical protein
MSRRLGRCCTHPVGLGQRLAKVASHGCDGRLCRMGFGEDAWWDCGERSGCGPQTLGLSGTVEELNVNSALENRDDVFYAPAFRQILLALQTLGS